MGEAGGPFSSFRDVHGPHPTLGGPGATRSVILMLAAGPGCCKHPYATLLQGLRVASNHCHLLAWHRAQAPSPGSRARQRLVLRRAPQAERGSSSSGRPLGEQKNKRQISLSLKKRSISLKTQPKTRSRGRDREGHPWGPEYSRAGSAQLRVLGDGRGGQGRLRIENPSKVVVSSWRQPPSLAVPVTPPQ